MRTKGRHDSAGHDNCRGQSEKPQERDLSPATLQLAGLPGQGAPA
jgi:hypothetical protein